MKKKEKKTKEEEIMNVKIISNEEFDKILNEKICFLDGEISIEAKGLYYSALINARNSNPSLKELIRGLNIDEEFAFRLTEELIKYGYLVLGIPMTSQNVFIFNIKTGE